jgi:flagellar biosynthesis protein FlhA
LLDRIGAIRRQLAAEMGFIMPPVRIRDNMQIPPHEYRIKIRSNTVASGQTRPGRLLAMDSGIASGAIEGEPTREPAFGLDAWWIEPSLKGRAETMNYTVVDPTSVLATHLTEIVRRHADELLTREEVTTLLDQLKEKSPKLVGDLVPDPVKPGDLQKILQNLLRERIPIRDLESILETLADWCPRTKDLDVLTEYVRNALRRTICRQYAVAEESGGAAAASAGSGGEAGRLVCITLDPALEDQISGFVDRSAGSTVLNMPAPVANRIAREVMKGLERLTAAGHQPIILASPPVRAVIRQIMEPHVPGVVVLGFNEVVQGVEVESMALVSMAQQAQAMSAA